MAKLHRETVDLSAYPDLVVMYLGMRVTALGGIKTLLGFGPKVDKAAAEKPEGLLHHENGIIFNLFPLHIGMRWYWRDMAAVERWTRIGAHKQWWLNFLKDSGGTSFWHESYCIRGGMEAVYMNEKRPLGLKAFAPIIEPRGAFFTARGRCHLGGDAIATPAGTQEADIYPP